MYAQNYKKCKCGFDFRKCLHLQISFGFCALLFANMHVKLKILLHIEMCVEKSDKLARTHMHEGKSLLSGSSALHTFLGPKPQRKQEKARAVH